jgi:hypothetical protein
MDSGESSPSVLWSKFISDLHKVNKERGRICQYFHHLYTVVMQTSWVNPCSTNCALETLIYKLILTYDMFSFCVVAG